MKKSFIYAAAFAMSLSLPTVLVSCDDDDDDAPSQPVNPNPDVQDPANIEYTSKNAKSWHNYTKVVANLLKNDSQKLYDEWANGYAEGFKNPGSANNPTGFKTYIECAEQIVDGCSDIAAEVGGAKLGDPYKLYMSGDKTAALYAVESWYSWHSKEDYSNNIVSVQNAYYGHRNLTSSIDSEDHTFVEHSIAALVKAKDPQFFQELDDAIKGAYKAIMNIPTPFRNHIGSKETVSAMDACDHLNDLLVEGKKNLRSFLRENYLNDDAALEPVIKQYVDAVIMPTYSDLRDKNNALFDVISTLAANPTDANFQAACDAWIEAREPWEESEAYLFGPVANLGLDPNMDSWPLDQAAIVNILNSGKFDDLTWDGDFDESNEEIANKQSVRGYHTLEFLLFKDGKARTINK